MSDSALENYSKLPRLYVEANLADGQNFVFADTQAHYLKNVMRRNEGDEVRVFNGRDGEWIARLDVIKKKQILALAVEQIRPQVDPSFKTHLYFAPIKKQRLPWLIEKAVELGATDLHPVITQNTERRNFKEDKVKSYITEATEQCERCDIVTLHDPLDLQGLLRTTHTYDIFTGITRNDGLPLLSAVMTPQKETAVFIGPEGGFTDEEVEMIYQSKQMKAIRLSDTVLRAETACCIALALIKSINLS